MPTYMRHAVVGYFKDERSAQAAFQDLLDSGFSKEAVHLSSSNDYATEAATGGAGLTGRAPAESHGGGISGWFRSLFGSDEYETDAAHYSEQTRGGGSVIAVDATDEDREQAITILNDNGATDVDQGGTESAEVRREVAATTRDQAQEGTIPVVREDIQIGKRAVQSGGVRVYSRTVEQPVEEQVRLRQERVVVDRQPVDRAVTPADEAAWRDQTIEVVGMSEEPLVQKRARVVEEVRVGKQATERTETVRDTVRHTEVQTEPIGVSAGGRSTDYSADFERDFQSRYGVTGGQYQTYAPAYEYGSSMAGDPQYQGRNWADVESNLRSDYGRRYPESSWDRMKDAVRYGWDKVTGKRSA